MSHSICKVKTDAEVMEMVFTWGTENLYPRKCPRAIIVTLGELHAALNEPSYSAVESYRHDQLKGCQKCQQYKGDYPELKIKDESHDPHSL